MNFDEFTGEVQHRLELASTGEAVRASRAVLATLGERLGAGEAEDLAGPLPMEIDRYLIEADSGQQFGLDEFLDRVAERANVDESEAAYYARAIVALLGEVVTGDELDQVREQLSEEFGELFELVDEPAPE